ncbi:hypothetical protein CPR_1624 [Clostridium perfringens SM101]|uniref:Uncharacterized protein n=1 Tax=Clostridium perfringens (strain SM101 / Type A) TaxID=289380 RepID=Q0SSG7_CLOPS|nr:hypothetical protein [Clostridium perfringens]ABG87082.1 hypothetical protein CPR_1624 [Clostridium perfringens SM101]
MGIFVLILQIILLAVVIFGGFSLLSRFVFNKVKINKWIILVAAIIIFLIPMFIHMNQWIMLAISAVATIYLWFLDILRNGYPKLKKEKKVVINQRQNQIELNIIRIQKNKLHY